MRRKGAGLESAVRVLVYGGAIGAVVAVLFGWIHTGLWFGGDTVMQVHRWNGMLIAVLGIVMAYLASRPSQSRAWLRASIFSMAALVLIQGFLGGERSEEHTSELQSLMRISYAVFCLKKKNHTYHKKSRK